MPPKADRDPPVRLPIVDLRLAVQLCVLGGTILWSASDFKTEIAVIKNEIRFLWLAIDERRRPEFDRPQIK